MAKISKWKPPASKSGKAEMVKVARAAEAKKQQEVDEQKSMREELDELRKEMAAMRDELTAKLKESDTRERSLDARFGCWRFPL